ncbi:MAG TPA: glycosyltransferase, partial [bacterium]|nr:glycosyltransferase [bacterium]
RLLARCRTDRIICVSESDAASVKSCLRLTSSSDILSWVPNGIEYERFASAERDDDYRRRLGVEDGEIALGTVGRLRPQKALGTLVLLGRLLKEARWKFKILIVGEGFLEQELRLRIRDCGLEEEVRLLGYREDIPRFLQALDVFLLVSLWEGFPIAVLEAMAAGLPIVATRVPGTQELLEPVYGNRLAAVRDPDALMRLLGDWRTNREQWQTLAEEGRMFVRANYTVEKMVASTEQIYQHLLEGTANPMPSRGHRG